MQVNGIPKVRVAFIDETTYGIGPSGGAVQIEPGAYVIAQLDGMESGLIMLKGADDVLIGIIPVEYASEIRETVSQADPVGWATYRRRNPEVQAVWGEQNGRMAPTEGR